MIRRIVFGMTLSALTLVSSAAINSCSGPGRTLPNATTCQEDQPCWNPAAMGNGKGYVCSIEPDGSIQRWHDTTGMTGSPVDCPR